MDALMPRKNSNMRRLVEDARRDGSKEKHILWDEFLLDKERDMRRRIDDVRREFAKVVESTQFFENQFNRSLAKLDRRSQTFRNTFLDYIRMLQEIEFSIKEYNLNIAAIEESYINLFHHTPSEYSSRRSSFNKSFESVLDVESLKSTKLIQDGNGNDASLSNQLARISLNKNAPEFISQFQATSHPNCHQANPSDAIKTENPMLPSLLDASVSEITLLAAKSTESLKATGDLFDLPPQEVLETGRQYPCVITWVENPDEFYITVDEDTLANLFTDMTVHYKNNYVKLKSEKELESYTYCACYQSGIWFRALITAFNVDNNPKLLECYLIDVGRPKVKMSYVNVRPLISEYRKIPVLARLCHLSYVKPLDPVGTWSNEAINYLKDFRDITCFVNINDNDTESLGVFITLRDLVMINLDIGYKGLAQYSGPDNSITNALKNAKHQEDVVSSHKVQNIDDGLDQYSGTKNESSNALDTYVHEDNEISNGYQAAEEDVVPMGSTDEYYDPLLAVQGYQNRDEIDLCKHYKGPPDTTCFKGKKCNKRHELMHPDGWTKDKEVVIASTILQMILPRAGTKIDVIVTYIISENKIKGQILHPPPMNTGVHSKKSPAIPNTLGDLIMSMNKNNLNAETKLPNCSVRPAIGELLAAQYSLDNKWYRVQVLGYGDDNDVMVSFVDYGNNTWVNYKHLRDLDTAHIMLPFQAVTMLLADVGPPENTKKQGDIVEYKVQCKVLLHKMILNKKLTALVTCATSSQLEIILYDETGIPVVNNLSKHCNAVIKKVIVQDHPENQWLPG